MAIGYHYTTPEAWQRIQKEGLVPQPIPPNKRDEIAALLVNQGVSAAIPDRAFHVWPHRPSGADHAGSVLFHLGEKASWRIVLLGVDYDPATRWSPDATLWHRGRIGDLEYHRGEVHFHLLTYTLPAEKVWLEREYNVVEALR